MLFGSQYDDDDEEGGTDHSGSPTTPLPLLLQTPRTKTARVSSTRAPRKKGAKSVSRNDRTRTSLPGAAAAVIAAGPSSPTQSLDSTTSSSTSTASYSLMHHQRNGNNYNANAANVDGTVSTPRNTVKFHGNSYNTNTSSSSGTLNSPSLLLKTRRRSTKKKGDRASKKFKRPVDRHCMYPSVWKQLHFAKKIVQLATNLSEKPVCVTGVDGFLASWIVCELLNRGYRVRGCDFVIHTGTPSSCSVRDPLSEQQEPGVHSVGSRMHCIIPMMTNFIQACARSRIKRVVLTSSIAAMADSVTPDSIINDACWNVTSSLEKNPHYLSLKLAEEAAWQLVDQLPSDRRIDLVTMNPGGPAQLGWASTSILSSARPSRRFAVRLRSQLQDHEAVKCGCCHVAFTFYRRKHHCRECGVIICNDCSMSRAVVEGSAGRARLCDKCVEGSIPDLLDLLRDEDPNKKRTAVIALESLMENPLNHDYITRFGGILLLMDAIHHHDESISSHAAGALCALSCSVASTLQMVLEGAVLQMLEVEEMLSTWAVCLEALRNIWKQINRQDFRRMLHAVARVSADANIGELRGNILLTFVHMMDAEEVVSLLSEGLMSVLYHMLQSTAEFSRCAAAHAIKHLVPAGYDPDVTIDVPPYLVDDHEELFLNSSLSDLQFLVKGHIAPINAHKVVLFFRNSYFKNVVRYTGKVDITPDVAEELLRASSFYCVYELQKRTEAFLSGQICVENVVDLLTLSEECNADDLKKNCVPFLMRHIHEIVRLPAFEEHRVRSSEEVLKALTNMLGSEWESSYTKFKQSIGMKDKERKEESGNVEMTHEQQNSQPVVHQVNDFQESPLSPRFLLSPVPPPGVSRNVSAFATDSPRLNTVGEDKSIKSFHFMKTFGNEDVLFRRSRNLSEDISEGLSEGVC
uniref:FYVE-type domain-containing protein n=1 Tax=Hyaloperonospora arabidopsidis (strain Emoy2) TaxID=559515 RepID=M4B4J7_HYAAE